MAIAEEVANESEIRLVNVHFPKGAEIFYGDIESDGLAILSCHFYGAVNMSGLDFPTGCSFAKTTFHQDAFFQGSTFQHSVKSAPNFRGATFRGRAKFHRCTFYNGEDLGDCDFNHSTFKEKADFSHVKARDLGFYHIHLGSNLNFTSASLRNLNISSAVRIADSANPSVLQISNSNDSQMDQIIAYGSEFDRIEISNACVDWIDLSNAHIKDKLHIFYSTLEGKGIDLTGITSQECIEVNRVDFEDHSISFQNATLSGSVEITDCTFARSLDVVNVADAPANFSLEKCVFDRGLLLEGNSPSGKLFAPPENGKEASQVNLTGLTFGLDCPVSIRNVDLQNACFLDTDVRNIEFTGVTWDEKTGPYRIARRAVHDEVSEEETDDPDYRKLERLYRELKQSFESRKNWYSAGHFHIGEKEMQRKGTDSSARRAMLTIYRCISLYGERALPAFVALALTLLGFAALYIGIGLQPADPDGYLQFWGGSWEMFFWSWGRSLNFAVQHIVIGRASGYELAAGAQFLTVIQRVLCTTLVALAALAIRQQMKR